MFYSAECGLKTKMMELREGLSSQLLIWDRHDKLNDCWKSFGGRKWRGGIDGGWKTRVSEVNEEVVASDDYSFA